MDHKKMTLLKKRDIFETQQMQNNLLNSPKAGRQVTSLSKIKNKKRFYSNH